MPTSVTQSKDIGLPRGIELLGAIKDYALHELRQCDCMHVMTRTQDAMDSACHVGGTPEHDDQARRYVHMRFVAEQARTLRRN